MEIDDLVQKAADVLHADGQHALFCFSPQRYKSQPVSSVLSAQRRIEDKMLKCKLNFETAISIRYHVESMRANDRRHLSAMTRFAVSDELPADQWLQSQAARGKIENVPLARVREMKKLLKCRGPFALMMVLKSSVPKSACFIVGQPLPLESWTASWRALL